MMCFTADSALSARARMTDPGGPGPGATSKTPPREKKRWATPELRDLPRLTDLTLLTGSPIGGGGDTGGGGSTVF
jgi:hypothetical protein